MRTARISPRASSLEQATREVDACRLVPLSQAALPPLSCEPPVTLVRVLHGEVVCRRRTATTRDPVPAQSLGGIAPSACPSRVGSSNQPSSRSTRIRRAPRAETVGMPSDARLALRAHRPPRRARPAPSGSRGNHTRYLRCGERLARSGAVRGRSGDVLGERGTRRDTCPSRLRPPSPREAERTATPCDHLNSRAPW